ncbi:MAG: cytochrome c3 family protein [Betaproteobacteria bacterium]|nr:cytochrome c3 family protein [Betaproteobacteria bacterium]
MTHHKSSLHLPAGPLAVALFLMALLVGQPAVAQTIVGSKHDLTSATGTGSYRTSSTAEICVFCHTPHGGSSTAPLWNKGASGGSFTSYSSATLDAAILPVGSSSATCLTCHDGVSGLDNMINAPGSGLYNAGGASQGYNWTVGGNVMAGGVVTTIGQDLSNDHPIGAAYCAGFTALSTCRDTDFKLTSLNRFDGTTTTTGAGAAVTTGALTDQYWIDTSAGALSSRQKTDVILYTRAFTSPAFNLPSVECASCHEPHNGTGNATFLRVSNAASALCTTCHSK